MARRLAAAGDPRLVAPLAAAWAAAWSVGRSTVVAGVVVLSALALVAAGLLLRRREEAAATAAVAALAAASALLGVHAASRNPLALLAGSGGGATVQLVLTGDPRPAAAGASSPGAVAGDRVVVPARAERVSASGRRSAVRVAVVVLARGPGWLDLLPGQRLRVAAEVEAGRDGVPLLSVRGPPRLVGRPPWWQRAAGAIRTALRVRVAGWSPDLRGLLPSMVTGDRAAMPRELRDDAERTGLPHVVAVSGFSVLVVVAAVLGLARAARLPRGVQALAGLAALAADVVLVRPEPRIVRAAAMAVVALLALALGRRRSALPALCGSALVLLLLSPALAGSAGFALSVAGVLGLVLLGPPLSAALRARGWPHWLADSLALPVAAHLATAPLVAMLRGDVALVTAPANALAEPAVTPVVLLGLPAAVLAAVGLGGVAGPLLWLARWPAAWVAQVAHRGAHLPGGVVDVPSGPAALVVTPLLLWLGWQVLRRPGGRRAVAAALLATACAQVTVRRVLPAWPPRGWAMVVCDVGQGDSVVLRTRPGHAVVVDTGPDPRVERRCLDRLDVGTVDLLVLTHTHADHFGGLDALLAGRRVAAVWAGPLHEPAAVWAAGAAELAADGLAPATPGPGSGLTLGALRLDVLAPGHAFRGTHSDPNNSSLVLRVTGGGLRALLTGDVEVEAQRELLASADVRADVLKVPHHGSRFQDGPLLDAVGARLAVASVGNGNPYGHPSADTLGRLATDGATVLRTDRDGSVAVVPGPDGPHAYAAGDPLPAPDALGSGRLLALCEPRARPVGPAPGAAAGAPAGRPRLG